MTEPKPWAERNARIVASLELAAKVGAHYSLDSVGCEAMATLLKQMSSKLDAYERDPNAIMHLTVEDTLGAASALTR